MKKIAVLLFLFALCGASLFADISNSRGDASSYLFPGLSDRPFQFRDSRLERLGGTGVVLSTGMSSLYYNPANLADNRMFMINVPQINLRLYNATKLLKIEGMRQFISDLLAGKEISTERKLYITKMVIMEYGYGIYPIVDAQVDVGFKVEGFAFDALVSGDITLYNLTGRTIDSKLIPSFTAGVSVGYGHKFKAGKIEINAGLSFSLLMRVFLAGTGLADFNEISNEFPGNLKTGVALQPPINIGVTAKFLDCLKASLVIRNINFFGTKVYSYGDFNHFLANIFQVFGGSRGSDSESSMTNLGSGLFSSSVDLGVAYNPEWDLFNPRVEIDFVNIFSFGKNAYYDNSNFFSHLKIGVEMYLLSFLKIGAGLNQGRICFGATLDLWPIVIDVDYGWVDASPTLGEAMTDRVSVCVKLGWDRSK